MTNVKPGDMAKVVPPHQNVGMIVEVLEPMTEADRVMLLDYSSDYRNGLVIWRCKIFSGGLSLDLTTRSKGYVYPGFVSLIWDAHLRRIEPPTEPTEIETLEEISE